MCALLPMAWLHEQDFSLKMQQFSAAIEIPTASCAHCWSWQNFHGRNKPPAHKLELFPPQASELISENQSSLVVLQVASNKSANTLNFCRNSRICTLEWPGCLPPLINCKDVRVCNQELISCLTFTIWTETRLFLRLDLRPLPSAQIETMVEAHGSAAIPNLPFHFDESSNLPSETSCLLVCKLQPTLTEFQTKRHQMRYQNHLAKLPLTPPL